jgi:hypothetical protein
VTKTCSRCKTVRPLEEFSPHKKARDKRNSWCKPCFRVYNRTRKARRTQREIRAEGLRHWHKLSIEQYEEMADLQGGRCAACGSDSELHVDHDHASGRVRGLLCGPCNRGLGMLREDAGRILGLLRYVLERTGFPEEKGPVPRARAMINPASKEI